MKDQLCQGWLEDHGRGSFICLLQEWSVLISHAKHCLKNIDKWLRKQPAENELILTPCSTWVQFEPLGVVCIMGSWNFPFSLCIRPLVEAITAGNCAVVRPSEISPKSALIIQDFIIKYLDPQAIVCLNGQVELSKMLSQQKFDKFFFVGSTAVG